MSEVKLIQKPDDPVCLRISAGGNHAIGFYCVFRGDKEDVIECLEEILDDLKRGFPVIQED